MYRQRGRLRPERAVHERHLSPDLALLRELMLFFKTYMAIPHNQRVRHCLIFLTLSSFSKLTAYMLIVEDLIGISEP